MPTNSGGRRRIFHTIKYLSQNYQLEVWSFLSTDSQLQDERLWLTSLGVKYRHFTLSKNSLLTSFLHLQPYWFTPWWNKDLVASLQSLEEKNWAFVQIDGTQLLYLNQAIKKSWRKIFVAYDISTISFWRRLLVEKNVLKKCLQLWRLFEIYLYERIHLGKFSKVIAMSKFDANYLRNQFGVKKVEVIPNGIEQVDFLPNQPNKKKIVLGYIGAFSHPPNLEAVRFIIDKILPALEKKRLNYELLLAGEQDRQLVEQLMTKQHLPLARVRLLGYVAESSDFYQQIDVLVAPIFSGSGTKIKILESLSFGRPVVTTKVGAEGIAIESDFLNVIEQQKTKDEEEWSKKVIKAGREEILEKERVKLKKILEDMRWSKVFAASSL